MTATSPKEDPLDAGSNGAGEHSTDNIDEDELFNGDDSVSQTNQSDDAVS